MGSMICGEPALDKKFSAQIFSPCLMSKIRKESAQKVQYMIGAIIKFFSLRSFFFICRHITHHTRFDQK